MSKKLKLIKSEYFKEYCESTKVDWFDVYSKLSKRNLYTKKDFDYSITSASVYSSRIEGNTLKVNDYFKNKLFKVESKKREMNEVDDLVEAYNFSKNNTLNKKNLLKAHYILTDKILENKSQRGKLRKDGIGIASGNKYVYFGIDWSVLDDEFNKLFEDIETLLRRNLTTREVFYFASMIHMVFEHIHPFMDGNGRTGRLLEKWFIAEKLGENAWSIESEKCYEENKGSYYKNISIGFDYEDNDYRKSIPFLVMLPNCLFKQLSK